MRWQWPWQRQHRFAHDKETRHINGIQSLRGGSDKNKGNAGKSRAYYHFGSVTSSPFSPPKSCLASVKVRIGLGRPVQKGLPVAGRAGQVGLAGARQAEHVGADEVIPNTSGKASWYESRVLSLWKGDASWKSG